MCVGINGPGDLSLSPFDLETGILVASKVGNVHSEFEHARTLGSRVIRYVRDTACILCVIINGDYRHVCDNALYKSSFTYFTLLYKHHCHTTLRYITVTRPSNVVCMSRKSAAF